MRCQWNPETRYNRCVGSKQKSLAPEHPLPLKSATRTIAVWLMPRSCKVQRDFNALAPIIVFQNPILCSNPWLAIGSEQNNFHRGSCVLPQVQQWRWVFRWRCAECSKHFHLFFEWHVDLILTYPHMLRFPCTFCTYNMHTCEYIYIDFERYINTDMMHVFAMSFV